jgi:hypothetical protein
MPFHFDIIRDGNLFSSRADGGPKFAVGQQVHFHENRGLANDNSPLAKQFNYAAANFSPKFPFWAEFIEPTAFCEGRSFITLNSYDRAKFTFGFAQFAAHVPDGDFVTWMRAMLQRPEANDYFPDLSVENGRIVKVGAQSSTPLESSGTTQPLMDYLNPSLGGIDDEEVIAAAKFIHWTMNHAESQSMQVQQMVNVGHTILSQADKRIGLDGKSGDLCCIVMDIRHQGRGTFADMHKALQAADPYRALMAIGAIPYPERVRTLKKLLDPRREAFAKRRWSRAKQELVYGP